jgi:hypothetical protein
MSDYQLLPPLSDDEFGELKESIKANGVLVPVVFDQDGNTIDGRHRKRACEALGITDYPRETRTFTSDEQRHAFIYRVNLNRRHLSPYERQQVVTKMHDAHPKWSVRKIAELTGIPKSTVQRCLHPPESPEPPSEPEPPPAAVPNGTGTKPAKDGTPAKTPAEAPKVEPDQTPATQAQPAQSPALVGAELDPERARPFVRAPADRVGNWITDGLGLVTDPDAQVVAAIKARSADVRKIQTGLRNAVRPT